MITENPYWTVDLHHHVGSLDSIALRESTARRSTSDGERTADIAARTGYLDAHGIDGCILMPGTYPGPGGESYHDVNAEVARYRDDRPERFLGALATADPRDVPLALETIDRAVDELGTKGFVWHHHFMGTFINDPKMIPLIERCHGYGLPVLVHIITDSFLESPWRLETLADVFPETTFVALDGFSSPDQAMWMPYIAEKHPNIYFDTGVAQSVTHLLPNFIRDVGADRLLFGSDFYSSPKLFELPFVIYELLNSGIDPDDLKAVFGGNAARILGLNPPT